MSDTHMPPIFFSAAAVLTLFAFPDPAVAAALSGRVSAAASVAIPAPLSVAVDTSTCAAAGKTVPDPRLVIGADRGVADVVVSVRGIPDPPPYPSVGEVLLDQQACVFIPHVAVVAPGQSLRVRNGDAILHTFRTIGGANRTVNKAQTGGKEDVFTFANPGIMTVECDVHYWMSAVVVVAANAFTAVSAKDGSFTIEELPPGKYEVEFWHQVLGTKTAAAEVDSDGGRLDVVLGPDFSSGPAAD